MTKKDILIGFAVGIVANAIGLIIATLLFGPGTGIADGLSKAVSQGFLTKLISIGALLNLGAFFLFISKNQDLKARGVLIATVFVAVVTLIIRLF